MDGVSFGEAAILYRSGLGRVSRALESGAGVLCLYFCGLALFGIPLRGLIGDSIYWLSVLAWMGLLLVGPAVTLSPCWALERDRGTLIGLVLAPLEVDEAWRFMLNARVWPWLRWMAWSWPAILFAAAAFEGLGDIVLWLGLLGTSWALSAIVFATATAAWTAARFRSAAAGVAVALLITLIGEVLIPYVCVLIAWVVCGSTRSDWLAVRLLVAAVLSLAVHGAIAYRLARGAQFRLSEMLEGAAESGGAPM